MRDAVYKYYVIKLEKPPNKCLSKYLCVRRSWTNKAPEDTRDANLHAEKDYGRVRAWYPFESSLSSRRVKSRMKPDLNQGGMHMARVKYRTDVYKDAKEWISLMEDAEGNKRNNEQNAPINQKAIEVIRSSNANELPSTYEISQDLRTKPANTSEDADRVDLTIVEESKDSEPVTSSSINNPEGQKPDDLVGCLIGCMQSLLKDVEREKHEQYRFEFDELRIVRVSDNNLLERLSKLSINIDHISCGGSIPEELTPAAQREAEVVIHRTKTAEAQETPSSSLPPIVSVFQSSPSNRSISSVQINAVGPENVSPSSGRSASIQSTQHISAYAEALKQIALNVQYLTENSTAADTPTSSNVRSALQHTSEPIVIDNPPKMQATNLRTQRYSRQVSVSPAAISSTTNDSPRTHHVHPTVTICSPKEINEKFAYQNSYIPVGFGSAINERTAPQNSSHPLGTYSPNVTIKPSDRRVVDRRRSSHYNPPHLAAVAPEKNRQISEHSGPIVDSVNRDLTITSRYFNAPGGYDRIPPLPQNSLTRNISSIHDSYERFPAQQSAPSTAIAPGGNLYARSLVQDSYNPVVYQNAEHRPFQDIPDSYRPGEQTDFRKSMHSSITRQPFPQYHYNYVPERKHIQRRNSTLQKRSSDIFFID